MSDIRTLLIDLCTRAGFDPDTDIDVSGMHGRLDGMVLTGRSDVRGCIEALQKVFFFDVVERDGKIRFIRRGGSAVVRLTEDDLVRRDDGTLVTVTRAQEEDLPRQVDVTYSSADSDYQSNTQSARRRHCSTQTLQTVSLPLSLADQQAREVADQILYLAWAERETVSFRLSLAHARLDPADVVALAVDGTSQRLRLTSLQLGEGLVEVDAVVDDADVLMSQSDGAAAGNKVKSLRLVPTSVALLLDVPPLREEDDGTSFYATVSYTGSDAATRWTGATLQCSRDGGASWQTLADLRRAATWGNCRTVLGSANAATWDEANTLEVVLAHGTLESRDHAAVLAGNNAALVGSEIIQFREAALIGTNAYRLAGLLRGRRGTEASVTGHGDDERFILLRRDDLVKITGRLEQIGAPLLVRAVSYGLYAGDQPSQSFTNHAAALKPFPPAHVTGGRDPATGDWTLTWTRRTRLGGAWLNGADTPLGEDHEGYEVEVLDSGTVRRTLSTVSPAVRYTAAQQQADFGTPQTSLSLRLYQLSALIGRGFPCEATL
jgi:hypothetical protein